MSKMFCLIFLSYSFFIPVNADYSYKMHVDLFFRVNMCSNSNRNNDKDELEMRK